MVGKKKRVKARVGKKIVKRVGLKNGTQKISIVEQERRAAPEKLRKYLGLGKWATEIQPGQKTSLAAQILWRTKRVMPESDRYNEIVDNAIRRHSAEVKDYSASKYYTDNPDQIEKHARAPHGGDLFGAKKDLTNEMLQRDYKKKGGEMKKVGKRVKAMGGKKVGMGKRVTAKKGKRVKAMGGTTMKGKRVKAMGGTTMKGKRVKARGGNKIQKLAVGGGIGAAAGAAAEKASKDKGTERGATSIASVNKMGKNKLKALLLEMLRQKNN